MADIGYWLISSTVFSNIMYLLPVILKDVVRATYYLQLKFGIIGILFSYKMPISYFTKG